MLVHAPRLLVFCSLFPSDVQPQSGLFIRERMFRVAQHLPIVVVAPQAWFPGQALIRLFRPHFRPMALAHETMEGIAVHRPRFFCIPGVLKWADGLFMALSSFVTVRRVAREHGANIIDAHFGYPDGYAAVLLGRWLQLPVMLTLRGKEERQSRTSVAAALRRAITGADHLIAVSSALRELAIAQGADGSHVQVVGNGVDLKRFSPMLRAQARRQLALAERAQVLVSVGMLGERKGFHRVIECLPDLLTEHPELHLLVVGGPGSEGDMGPQLKNLVRKLALDERVHFLGALGHEQLSAVLSTADVFVLATSYEGWANVFLEAMACGLPVVTTEVGGNAQVVKDRTLGILVPFGDKQRLRQAIAEALGTEWDRVSIRAYAESNSWDSRIPILVESYRQLASNYRRGHRMNVGNNDAQ